MIIMLKMIIIILTIPSSIILNPLIQFFKGVVTCSFHNQFNIKRLLIGPLYMDAHLRNKSIDADI